MAAAPAPVYPATMTTARRLRPAFALLLALSACVDTGYSPFGDDAFEIPDADNDGYPDSEDCEPDDVLSNPESVEICDGKDNDCDGLIDEDPVNGDLYFVDADGDGYGDPDQTAERCEASSGYVTYPGDCDDTDDSIHQGADELCDAVDNDCDDIIDEGNATDAPTWYPDADNDGYASSFGGVRACQAPSGYLAVSDARDHDCDDADPAISPGAQEVCDDDDNDEDCDGRVNDADDDTLGQTTWFYDADGDGYGTTAISYDACGEQPPYFSDQDGDCNDSNASIYPGAGC